MISFTVPGKPASQGSLKRFGRGFTHADPTLKRWRNDVGTLAKAAGATIVPRPGAVHLNLTFSFARPAKHVKKNGELSAEGKRVAFPTTQKDLDKTTRAILDALTGIAYEDDSQVCLIVALKHWGEPGVKITVGESREPDTLSTSLH